MILKSVRIDGFKNLSDIDITFSDITALVSLNNYGKSNVLTALKFGLDFIKANNDEKLNLMSILACVPLNKKSYNKNFKYEFSGLSYIDKEEYIVDYGYEFKWGRNDNSNPKVINEFLKIKLNEKNQKYSTILKRTEKKIQYKSSYSGRCDTTISAADNELVINKLKSFDDLYYLDIVEDINNMKMYIENSLDTKHNYEPDPLMLKNLDQQLIREKNLARVLHSLQINHPDKFELLKDVYLQLFSEFTSLEVEEFKIELKDSAEIPEEIPFVISNSLYVIFVTSENLIQPIPFEAMSDGAKRVLLILTKIVVSTISNVSLIAVEEPENSVHPGLLEAYLKIIDQLLDDCKIIMTSHSPYMISCLEPDWIYVGVNHNDGIAKFYPFTAKGKKQLQTDAGKYDLTMGDYLFSLLASGDDYLLEYLNCNCDIDE